MENNTPSKTVSKLYKRFKDLDIKSSSDIHWVERAKICKELEAITKVVGAIEVMSKNSIIKLCAMESSLRFMEPFRFLMEFSKTVEYIK